MLALPPPPSLVTVSVSLARDRLHRVLRSPVCHRRPQQRLTLIVVLGYRGSGVGLDGGYAGCLSGISNSAAYKPSGYQKIEMCCLLHKMVRILACGSFWESGIAAGFGRCV